MSKLRFRVVHSTSQDPGYPAEELNVHSPNTRGWQSVKFSEYPQELGFEIDGGDARLSQVQILSHQSKIATKVEIFIGQGGSYESASFKRLGYLSLDNNERSQYQARELKTVYIDYPGRFVRLLVHRNYVNKQNLFDQVGIVAVNLLGAEGPGSMPSIASGPGGGGGGGGGGSVGGYSNPLNDLSIDMNLDPQTAAKLRLLSDAKSRAIATEDYLMAKQIKAVESELKGMGSRLAQLDMAKRQAVGAEDYDRAKDIKDETDELRGEIERKILAIHIPGVTDGHRGGGGGGGGGQGHNQRAASQNMVPRFAASKDEDEGGGGGVGEDDGYNDGGGGGSNSVMPQRQQYQQSKGPQNIDDMPVGGGAGAGMGMGMGMGGGGYYEGGGGGGGNKKSSMRGGGGEYDDDGMLPVGERPIKPKARTDYADRDPAIGETEIPDRFREEEHFATGEHPLEGINGLSELPAPEELAGKAKDVSDQSGVTALIGEYRARCLFSKVWTLREAAITKIHMMLESDFDRDPGITSCITALATIVRIGVEDKIQQVLFNTVALLEDLLVLTRKAKMNRSVLAPLLDPVTSDLIEKLSDGNARIREGAKKGAETLAASSNIGPAVVGAHALKSLSSKQKSAWRPIVARLELLTDLVNKYGVGGNTGISTEALMKFAKDNGCFSHSNGEVCRL